MPKYRLNINFKPEDLNVINTANLKVVIVKHTEGNQDSRVTWVSFDAFMHNTVDWSEDYALYASNTQIMGGATINKLSDISAITQTTYNFVNGIFQNPSPDTTISPNTYSLLNLYKNSSLLTVGLAQSVTVNNEAFANKPVNAVYVPFNQKVAMTPMEKVDVYLQGNVQSSTVESIITSKLLTVEFTTQTEISVEYSSSTGQFVPVS